MMKQMLGALNPQGSGGTDLIENNPFAELMKGIDGEGAEMPEIDA